MGSEPVDEIRILNTVLLELRSLERDEQRKVLDAVFAMLGLNGPSAPSVVHSEAIRMPVPRPFEGDFTIDRTITAKEFLFEKRPPTDQDRVICLAYYLTHYRGMNEFQTADISLANTEAAQRKFSNPWQTVSNAARTTMIVPGSSKNYWRLSALGEVYVRALPDREAARSALQDAKPSRTSRRKTPKNSTKKNKKSKPNPL